MDVGGVVLVLVEGAVVEVATDGLLERKELTLRGPGTLEDEQSSR